MNDLDNKEFERKEGENKKYSYNCWKSQLPVFVDLS